MSFYSMYRIFKDVFKTIFGYKFWRKLLIMILIGVIVFFVLHNYGYCVEPDSSYNSIEKVGTLRDIGFSAASNKYIDISGYNTDIYKIDIADTIVITTNSAEAGIRIAVTDTPQSYASGTFLYYSDSENVSFEYYNSGYQFITVSYNRNRTTSVEVYQQVYSTYLKPLVTPTKCVISANSSELFSSGGTTTYYLNAFQINKGFNYKVSGISSDLNFYYMSELNQMDISSYEWFYYPISSTSRYWDYPSNFEYTYYPPNSSSSTGGGTISEYGNAQYRNIYTNYTNYAYSNQTNRNILPFYDTISNNEEFTASYTGWLVFMTTSDLSDLLEIWTDYNFYDHDTIYIDNRIQNVNSSVQQGTSQINQSVQDMSNTISDNLTNTNYNQSDVSFNTSSVDNVSSSATDGIFTTIFNNFNNAVSGGVSELVIPLPHNSGSITITSDIVSRHLGNLTLLVNAFWMYLFGIYAFRFVNNLIHSIKNGDILNGFNSSNEVITNTMV